MMRWLIMTLALLAPLAHAETDLLVGGYAHHFDRDAARAGDWCEALPLLGIDHDGWTAVAMRSSNCRLGIILGHTFRADRIPLRPRSWREPAPGSWRERATDALWIQPSAMVGAGVLGWRRDVQPVVLLGVGVGRGRLGVDLVVAPAGHQGFVGVIGRWGL